MGICLRIQHIEKYFTLCCIWDRYGRILARDGQIKDFTGIDSPYEKPKDPEIHINTTEHSIEESVDIIIQYLIKFSYI